MSCCLEVTCSGPLDLIARRALYDATCRPLGGSNTETNTCENLSSWTHLDPEAARAALGAHAPGCTVPSSAAVRTTTTLDCAYTVKARLRCDDSPG